MNSIIHNAPRGITVPRDVARPSAFLPDPLNVAPVSRARMCERVPLECCGGLENVDLSKVKTEAFMFLTRTQPGRVSGSVRIRNTSGSVPL